MDRLTPPQDVDPKGVFSPSSRKRGVIPGLEVSCRTNPVLLGMLSSGQEFEKVMVKVMTWVLCA